MDHARHAPSHNLSHEWETNLFSTSYFFILHHFQRSLEKARGGDRDDSLFHFINQNYHQFSLQSSLLSSRILIETASMDELILDLEVFYSRVKFNLGMRDGDEEERRSLEESYCEIRRATQMTMSIAGVL